MKAELTNHELLQILLHGEAGADDLNLLTGAAARDADFAKRITEELTFSEMLRQVLESGTGDAGTRFEASLGSSTLSMEDLLFRVRDGSASAFECNRVVKHLWESPDAVQELRRELALDEQLAEVLSVSKGVGAFTESLETRMWAETSRDHFVDDFAKRLERESSGDSGEEVIDGKILFFSEGWGRTAIQITSLAAAFAVGAFVLGQLASHYYTNAPSVASVVKSTSDVSWSEGASPGRNGSITSGLYRLNRGVVSMRMPSGSELTVEGPALFEVGDDSSTFVHAGIALARVPKTDLGISLRSKGLSISESARLVGIDARVDGETEAIVFNGDGGVCLTESGKCRELSEFEAVKADHFREKLVDVPYNPHAFSKAWALLSGVEDNLGSVRIELPGSEISSSKGEDGEVQVFVENESFRPANALEVDQVMVGEFAVAEANPGQNLQAKGELRSYLLQLWPSDEQGGEEVETSLTFDHPVVGVIFSSDRLDSSDLSVGSSMSQTGEDNGINPHRGMDSGNDEILLSQDRRTLNFRHKGGGNQVEQVRVLVALN